MKAYQKPGKRFFSFQMTEAQYRDLTNEYCGLCLACGETAWGDTEPDAEGYPCESCGESRVYGVEQTLMFGRIELVEEVQS